MKTSLAKKLSIIAILVFTGVVFAYFDLGQYLTLSYIKESQADLQQLYKEKSLLVIAVYMAVYILVTALSLPGAAVLTLAGGAIFGLTAGTIIVSFASTIGATLACIVARFLLRDWVQKKFQDKLTVINEGIDKEGAFYLFTLRLIPIFPFFVINLAIGLTKLPLVTFYWVSQLGMLAATIVFVNAGKELGKIDSVSGILSPTLLLSFAILGLFPLIVKKLIGFYKQKRVRADL